jgi:hypothetical protein
MSVPWRDMGGTCWLKSSAYQTRARNASDARADGASFSRAAVSEASSDDAAAYYAAVADDAQSDASRTIDGAHTSSLLDETFEWGAPPSQQGICRIPSLRAQHILHRPALSLNNWPNLASPPATALVSSRTHPCVQVRSLLRRRCIYLEGRYSSTRPRWRRAAGREGHHRQASLGTSATAQ